MKAEVFAKPGGRILPGGRRMERITAGDDVSSLEITWFNNPYAAQKLELGQEYYFQGIVTGGMLRRQMVNPQVRTDAQVKSSPFEAVYPQTEGLTSSAIAKCVRQLLPHAELLPDPLPSEMLKNTVCSPRPTPSGPSTAPPRRRKPLRRGGGSSTKSFWSYSWASGG